MIQGGDFKKSFHETVQGIRDTFHLSAGGTGFAGAVMIGVYKQKGAARKKTCKHTEKNDQCHNPPRSHVPMPRVHEQLSRSARRPFGTRHIVINSQSPPQTVQTVVSLRLHPKHFIQNKPYYCPCMSHKNQRKVKIM
ncbi:MAG: hypothetical protein LBP21_09680 [Synergistaceae bacterium]|jgi:hypothetical protein|nr:hypothetical protein [Synergistaceae bacterium]